MVKDNAGNINFIKYLMKWAISVPKSPGNCKMGGRQEACIE